MTSTELDKIPGPQGLGDKIEYARNLAHASLLPVHYREKPANVLLALELGEALHIPTIQAINGIHVIEGKPSASAGLISALVRRAGHKLRVTVDAKNNVVVAQLIRADDPEFTYESRWDMARAQTAGLAGKDNWKKHPAQMLRNRAIAEVARMGAEEALYGVSYTPDELTDDRPPMPQSRRVTAGTILGDQSVEVVDGEVVDQETGEATPGPDDQPLPLADGEPWSDTDLGKQP